MVKELTDISAFNYIGKKSFRVIKIAIDYNRIILKKIVLE